MSAARAVVVVHRSTMMAEGIAAALSRYREIVPIGVATTAIEGEQLGQRADAVAFDQYLQGAELSTARLRRKGVRVVLLGDSDPEQQDDEMRVSTRSTMAALAAALVPGLTSMHRPGLDRLTAREKQILSLVGRGLAGKQVARHLGISPKTVEHHKTRIYAKLGVSNQAAAVGHILTEDHGRTEPWIRSNI